MLTLLYVSTIVASYFVFRTLYIIQGDEAKYNPHVMTLIYMFIPIVNVLFPLLLILIYLPANLRKEINYKKFFRLK
jgi:hypothetical protein